MLGYLYQVRFALLLLIRAVREDTAQQASIEVLDDVTFSQDGTALELIQFKHTLGTQPVLSNASSALWKTLRIWSERLSGAEHLIDDALLTLVTSGRAADSSAAALLREGQGRDEVAALDLLRDIANTSKSETNKAAYDAFKALSIEQQRTLVSKVRVVDAAPNIRDVERQLILESRLFFNRAEAFISRLEGWWLAQVIDHLLAPEERLFITGDELAAITRSLVSQLQDDNLPVDFTFREMDESELLPHERVFVEQLRLVLNNSTRLRMAIGHYYRAYQQRSRWLREGLILPDELKLYEADLIVEWKTQFEIMRGDLGELPSETEMARLGRKLFDWADTALIRPLRPRHNDASFSRGSFHMLSNDFQVGWHPEFKERLAHLMADAARSA